MSGYSEIDLHTHSNKSDGELSPAELISKAANNGIRILALTDHDTVSGLKDARKAAIKNKRTSVFFEVWDVGQGKINHKAFVVKDGKVIDREMFQYFIESKELDKKNLQNENKIS